MSNDESTTVIFEEILQSIMATPKHQRRLKSCTFWDKLGWEKRTTERVEKVRDWLKQSHVAVNLFKHHSMEELAGVAFGTEDKEDWLILTCVPPEPSKTPILNASQQSENLQIPVESWPDEAWFTAMTQQSFGSEREIECFFVLPMLQRLGYDRADFAVGFHLDVQEGSTGKHKEADVVVFDGEKHHVDGTTTLLLFVTKMVGHKLSNAVIDQARFYSFFLSPVFYVVTDGNEIEVFLFRGAIAPDDPPLKFKRSELRQQWKNIYSTLHKKSVVAKKMTRNHNG